MADVFSRLVDRVNGGASVAHPVLGSMFAPSRIHTVLPFAEEAAPSGDADIPFDSFAEEQTPPVTQSLPEHRPTPIPDIEHDPADRGNDNSSPAVRQVEDVAPIHAADSDIAAADPVGEAGNLLPDQFDPHAAAAGRLLQEMPTDGPSDPFSDPMSTASGHVDTGLPVIEETVQSEEAAPALDHTVSREMAERRPISPAPSIRPDDPGTSSAAPSAPDAAPEISGDLSDPVPTGDSLLPDLLDPRTAAARSLFPEPAASPIDREEAGKESVEEAPIADGTQPANPRQEDAALQSDSARAETTTAAMSRDGGETHAVMPENVPRTLLPEREFVRPEMMPLPGNVADPSREEIPDRADAENVHDPGDHAAGHAMDAVPAASVARGGERRGDTSAVDPQEPPREAREMPLQAKPTAVPVSRDHDTASRDTPRGTPRGSGSIEHTEEPKRSRETLVPGEPTTTRAPWWSSPLSPAPGDHSSASGEDVGGKPIPSSDVEGIAIRRESAEEISLPPAPREMGSHESDDEERSSGEVKHESRSPQKQGREEESSGEQSSREQRLLPDEPGPLPMPESVTTKRPDAPAGTMDAAVNEEPSRGEADGDVARTSTSRNEPRDEVRAARESAGVSSLLPESRGALQPSAPRWSERPSNGAERAPERAGRTSEARPAPQSQPASGQRREARLSAVRSLLPESRNMLQPVAKARRQHPAPDGAVPDVETHPAPTPVFTPRRRDHEADAPLSHSQPRRAAQTGSVSGERRNDRSSEPTSLVPESRSMPQPISAPKSPGGEPGAVSAAAELRRASQTQQGQRRDARPANAASLVPASHQDSQRSSVAERAITAAEASRGDRSIESRSGREHHQMIVSRSDTDASRSEHHHSLATEQRAERMRSAPELVASTARTVQQIVRTMTPPSAPQAQQSPAGMQRESRAEPQPIRVTIGRIEVKAQTPSPAHAPTERPVQRQTAPIMTLDTYLKQRNGRSR